MAGTMTATQPQTAESIVRSNIERLHAEIGQCGADNAKCGKTHTGVVFFNRDGSFNSVERGSSGDRNGCYSVSVRGLDDPGPLGFRATDKDPLLLMFPKHCDANARHIIETSFRYLFDHVKGITDSFGVGDVIGRSMPQAPRHNPYRREELTPRENDIPHCFMPGEVKRIELTANCESVKLELLSPGAWSRVHPEWRNPFEAVRPAAPLYLVAGESKYAPLKVNEEVALDPAKVPGLLPPDFPCIARVRLDPSGDLMITALAFRGVEVLRSTEI